MSTNVLSHAFPPPSPTSPNGRPRQPPPRPTRPPSLRLSTMDPVSLPWSQSRPDSLFSHSTGTTYENYTLRISQFPPPPTTIPTASPLTQSQSPSSYSYQPVSAHSAPSPYSPNFSQNQSRPSMESSQVSFSVSQQEELLEDAFIANLLLTGRPGALMRESGSALQAWFDENLDPAEVPSPPPPLRRNSNWDSDPRMRHVPTSPTISARTSIATTMYPPPTTAPPPLPALPSPLFGSFFSVPQQQHVPTNNVQPGTASPTSPTSFATGQTGVSSTFRSSGEKTVVEATPAIPLPSSDVKPVGFARAAYLSKSTASKSPHALSPIQVPKVFSPNLIDFSSPGPSRLSSNTLSPFHPSVVLPGLPSPTSAILSPVRSSRHEPPPNVPEDVESEMEPSTAFYNHAKSQSKSRLSMSSLWSRLSRSTLSSKHRTPPAWATAEGRKELPPMPRVKPTKQEIEKMEQEMALSALANRASVLWQMLDSGRLPRNSMSTHRSVAPASGPIPVRDSWDAYNSPGYVDETALKRKRSQSIRSFFSRTTGRTTTDRHNGHFNVLDEELQRRYMEQIASSSASRSLGQLSNVTPEHEKVPSPSPPSSFDPYGSGPSGIIPEDMPVEQKRVTILDAPRPVRSPKPGPVWGRLAPGQGRMVLVAGILLLIVVIAVGLGLGLALRQDPNGTAPSRQASCSGNLTGVFCDIDSSCVCTGTGTRPCSPLAASVIAIIDDTNHFFNTEFNSTSVALAYWDVQGAPVGNACSAQASTIDISPGLTASIDTTRARWARSALLFNLLRSEDAAAAEELRSFISTTDFSALASSRGKTSVVGAEGQETYQKTVAGFTYDFDKMTVGAPPIKWRNVAKPSEPQTAQILAPMESVLDRFYTSSTALSKQTSRRLEHYWEHVLDLPMAQLPKFIAAVRSAPVLLPVDMTASTNSTNYATLLQGSSRVSSFPPPLACSPLINSARLKNINDIEGKAFGLSISAPSSIPSSFDPACFGSHPVYGVLDVLRLRTPFFDSRANYAKQAIVLGDNAVSRLLVRSGEALSGYPSASAPQDIPSSALDPGNYGTMEQLQHVLLDFLQAMPIRQASAVAVIIIATASLQTPPSDDIVVTTSGVTVDLKAVPILEVALFGTIGSTDVKSTVSSLATPSGSSLFFGSQRANTFRQWASSVATSENPVIWTDKAVTAKVVRSTKNTDETFEGIWTQASSIASTAGGGAESDVRSVWQALEKAGRLQ